MFILYPFPEPLPIAKARGVQVVNITHALASQDCRVDLIHTGQDAAAIYQHYGLDPIPGFNPITIPRTIQLLGMKLNSNRIFNFRLSRHINRLANKPDLIISRHLKTAYHLLRHHPEIPLLYDAHEIFTESTTNPKNRAALKKMEAYILGNATVITAISESLREDIQKHYGTTKPIHIVRTATTVPRQMPEKEWQYAGKHIIYTGSLYNWKGVDDVIEAGKAIDNDFRITMIGGNDAQIATLKKRLGEHLQKFEFLPFMAHERIKEYLAKACIAILPNIPGSVSQWTSPLKLFEYMANGCAIIATDIPTIREILTPEQARFYASGDVDALVECIRDLSAKPDYAAALGRKNHELAQQHSWSQRAQQILSIFSGSQ